MSGPLHGIRILDLSRIFAGPWASQLLGDLGAEVIKIERPGSGDDTRAWGPPFARTPEGERTTETGYFMGMNRAKSSVTVNMAHAEGRELILNLARSADVVLENFRPGTLAGLGLGWPEFQAVNPRLICCSISGFGQEGTYRDRPAYDFAIQAMAGLMSITGEHKDMPGGGPQKVGVAVIDLVTGMYAAIGILAALSDRERSGKGQVVDVAMLDASVAMLSNQAMNYLISGRVPECAGNNHPNIVPQGVFHAEDGPFVIAVGNDVQFRRLCELLDIPAMADDARFATNPKRVLHRVALDQALQEKFATATVAQWVEKLGAGGVPSAPINNLEQVFADPLVQERGLRFDMPHPACGSIPQVANPIRLSGTPISYDIPPPLLGEHTDDILSRVLGLSSDRITQLRSCGAI